MTDTENQKDQDGELSKKEVNEVERSLDKTEEAEVAKTQEQINHSLEFHGRGFELFKIFISNLFLSVLTLGIYRAWAKAKVLRYMYSSTRLMGKQFQFHGLGKEIFIGYIKAIFVIGAIYSFITYLETIPALQSIQGQLIKNLILYTLLFPLIILGILGSKRYRLSRTSWRGIHFGLDGTYKELFKLILKGVFFTIVTLGFYYPFFKNQLRIFWAKYTRFGKKYFHYYGNVKELFRFYIPMIVLVIVLLSSIFFFFLKLENPKYILDQNTYDEVLDKLREDGLQDQYHKLMEQFTSIVDEEFEDRESFEQAIVERLNEEELTLYRTAIFSMPSENHDFGLDENETLFSESLESWIVESSEKMDEQFILSFLGFLSLLYFVIMIYNFWLFASVERYLWAHTQFDTIQFNSTLKGFNYFIESMISLFTIIFTLGIGTPWAAVRFQRFYLSQIHLRGEINFSTIEQADADKIKATGEGINMLLEFEQ